MQLLQKTVWQFLKKLNVDYHMTQQVHSSVYIMRIENNVYVKTCRWECKLIQPLWKTGWRFLKKLKIELPYDPSIPLLGIYLEKTKTLI